MTTIDKLLAMAALASLLSLAWLAYCIYWFLQIPSMTGYHMFG